MGCKLTVSRMTKFASGNYLAVAPMEMSLEDLHAT